MRVDLAHGPPAKPQIHSYKNHHTYNGVAQLPVATSVRRSPAGLRQLSAPDGCGGEEHAAAVVVYDVVLYYAGNRACTIYQTLDDFAVLGRGRGRGAVPLPGSGSGSGCGCSSRLTAARDLDQLLRDALAKRSRDCGVEYFLRRRLGDCGGR
ncbi:hypothetical protein B0T26DRAFT_746081 [Lasiosphaeria miniovina]|uniref:Uncharacterized protein n=1 Tax=Lasiosphaeria miniovina TaxID=1954250 RepID=A0AA40BH72_9PEZI|nr:uncharacterized protein B0T26DRAFT_746081 [Lasiosphaeria miniovina]KAK0734129.1 hypothetical protein B0T26DRAFT_746081 [Lasiosphaeria miniovina]